MDIITVTTTNSNDPSCVRLVLRKHFEWDVTQDPTTFVAGCIKETEDEYRAIFPRGMRYTLPFTTVNVLPKRVLATLEDERAQALNAALKSDSEPLTLLKQAYSSGQLQGTMIGDKLRNYFGVNYHEINVEVTA